jgi:hypothetical protein
MFCESVPQGNLLGALSLFCVRSIEKRQRFKGVFSFSGVRFSARALDKYGNSLYNKSIKQTNAFACGESGAWANKGESCYDRGRIYFVVE